MVSVGQHLRCLHFEKKYYQELTVMVLQRAALIPNAKRYPAAWSSACTGSGRGWGFSGVFFPSRFKNCWYASPSAKLRPVAVWTSESNWKRSISGATFPVENIYPSAIFPRTFPSPRSQIGANNTRTQGSELLGSKTFFCQPSWTVGLQEDVSVFGQPQKPCVVFVLVQIELCSALPQRSIHIKKREGR